MQASAIENGTIMQGEYTLLDPIGTAGSLFRARSRRDGRLVLVRLWRGQTVISPDRVLEKPTIAGRVQHPMLASLEACGRESDGTWYLISELAPGMPLHEWADQVGIPPLGSVVDFMHRLCQGLSAADREGLAHDALHSGNVMVVQPEPSPKQRLSGKILEIGVPSFMMPWPPPLQVAQFLAPEQISSSLRADAVPLSADSRMNVYSCGALLYDLCTGGAPYPSRSLDELIQAHADGKQVPPPSKINPQLPPALEAVILRSLSLQRGERYVNVTELATALSRVRVPVNTSGVRPRAEAPSARPKADSHGPKAKGSAFDERPTSESRFPVDWSALKPLSAPPPSGDSLPPVLEDPMDTLRPPTAMADARGTPSTPAGSFSSAPPLAPKSVPPDLVQAAAASVFNSSPPQREGSHPPQRVSSPGPLPHASAPPFLRTSSAPGSRNSTPGPAPRGLGSVPPLRLPSSMPPPPDARDAAPFRNARRAPPIPAVVKPLPVELSALNTGSENLPVLLAEHEPSGNNYLPGLYQDPQHAPAPRPRTRMHPVWLAIASIALLGGLGFWLLRSPSAPPKDAAGAISEPRGPGAGAVPMVTPPRLKSRPESKREAVEAPEPHHAPAVVPVEGAREAAARETAEAEDRPQRASAARASRSQRSRAVATRRGTGGRRAEAETERTDDEAAEAEPPAPTAAAAAVTAPAPPPKEAQPEHRESAEAGKVAREPERSTSAPAPEEAAPAPPVQPELPLQAQALVQSVTVRGSLATSVVMRAVERIRSQFVACYARAAGAAGRNGFSEVIVDVQLDERGRAQTPKAVGGALPGLASCVEEAAGRLATDRPPDTGTVRAGWKVVFAP